MECVRLKKKGKTERVLGTSTLLHHLWWLEMKREELSSYEKRVRDFLNKRPNLNKEFEAFLGAGGGSRDDLKLWLERAARPRPRLALVVDNSKAA